MMPRLHMRHHSFLSLSLSQTLHHSSSLFDKPISVTPTNLVITVIARNGSTSHMETDPKDSESVLGRLQSHRERDVLAIFVSLSGTSGSKP